MAGDAVPSKRVGGRGRRNPRANKKESPKPTLVGKHFAHSVSGATPEGAEEEFAPMFRMRERFSKWLVWVVSVYAVWYGLMVFFLWRFSELRAAGTLPLTAMIASPTVVTLAILIPVLNGIYRQERREADFLRMIVDLARGGTVNGS